MNLPDLIQNVKANVGDYVAGMKAAEAVAGGFAGKVRAAQEAIARGVQGRSSAKFQADTVALAAAERAAKANAAALKATDAANKAVAKSAAASAAAQAADTRAAIARANAQNVLVRSLGVITNPRSSPAQVAAAQVAAARAVTAAQSAQAAATVKNQAATAAAAAANAARVKAAGAGTAAGSAAAAAAAAARAAATAGLPTTATQHLANFIATVRGIPGHFMTAMRAVPGVIAGAMRDVPKILSAGFTALPGMINVSLGRAISAIPGMVAGAVRSIPSLIGTAFSTAASVAVTALTAIGIAVAGLGVAFGLAGVAGYLFLTRIIAPLARAGMEIERLQTTFGVLTGSLQRGKQLFADIQATAIITPYTVNQLGDTAQTLLGMGVATDAIIPSLRRLGDIAGGDADRLKRVALAYGEVVAEGRLTGQRMRQFAAAGIGAQDFAETIGVPQHMLRTLISSGQIGRAEVEKTIDRLTSEGGRFFQMSEASLNTAYGQWQRLGDAVEQAAGKIGLVMLKSLGLKDGFASLTQFVTDMTPHVEKFVGKISEVIGGLLKELQNILPAIAPAIDIVASDPTNQRIMNNLIPGQGTTQALGQSAADKFLKVVDTLGAAAAEFLKFVTKMISALPDIFYAISNSFLGWQLGLGGFDAQKRDKMQNDLLPMEQAGKNLPYMWQQGMGALVMGVLNNRRNNVGAANLGQAAAAEKLSQSTVELSGAARELQENAIRQGGVPGNAAFPGTGRTVIEKFRASMQAVEDAQHGPKQLRDLAQSSMEEAHRVPKGTYKGMFRGGKGTDENIGGGALDNKALGWMIQTGRMSFEDAQKIMSGAGNRLTPQQAGNARFDRFEELKKEVGLQPISQGMVSGSQMGSVEAMDDINKAMLNNQSVLDETLQVVQAALELDQQKLKVQQDTLKALESIDAKTRKDLGLDAVGIN